MKKWHSDHYLSVRARRARLRDCATALPGQPEGRSTVLTRTAARRVTRMCAVVVAVAVGLVLAPVAHAVPAPPPNPSDSEIAQSKDDAAASSIEVGKLSADVSTTQATIQRLNDAMELKRELVLKAQIDVGIAEADAQEAREAADEAQKTASDAAFGITRAEEHAAEFVAASFRTGTSAGSLLVLLDSESLDELLARQEMIEQVSGNQSGVIKDLQTSRATKANLDSAAQLAVRKAEEAEQAAVDAADVAEAAFVDAQEAFEEGEAELEALQTKLEQQQAAYQSAINKVAQLEGQRKQYEQWVVQKQQEDARIQEQAAVQQQETKNLQRELKAAKELASEEASNRKIAQQNEKKRQEKLRKEREAAAKQKENGKKPSSTAKPTTPSSDSGSRGELVVQAALAYLGTPYAWGGGNAKGPTRGIRDYGVADRYGDYKKVGFDCSGLALYAWAQQGVYLPHYSGYQYNYGKKVSRSNLRPGDLVFYAYNTSNPATIHHVAIYMGDNKMVEAPQSGSYVKISPMRWSGYIGATRPGT